MTTLGEVYRMYRMCRRCTEGVQKVYRRCTEGVQKVYRRCTYRRCTEGVQKVYRRLLVNMQLFTPSPFEKASEKASSPALA